MNFLSKCLVFFLNILISTSAFPETDPSVGVKGALQDRVPKKWSKGLKDGPVSRAGIRLRANWQVIASLGRGAKMTTAVETYAADGVLFQSSPQNWMLKIAAVEIPVNFFPSSEGAESFILVERGEVLKLLDIELTDEDRLLASDQLVQNDPLLIEGVRLGLSKAPSRQMDTIYRSPGEGLFLVKASMTLLK